MKSEGWVLGAIATCLKNFTILRVKLRFWRCNTRDCRGLFCGASCGVGRVPEYVEKTLQEQNFCLLKAQDFTRWLYRPITGYLILCCKQWYMSTGKRDGMNMLGMEDSTMRVHVINLNWYWSQMYLMEVSHCPYNLSLQWSNIIFPGVA